MCRILIMRQPSAFDFTPHLQEFSQMCLASKEFQGHGWGMAFKNDKGWHFVKKLEPIWESHLEDFGSGTFLAVHARSAFQNEGICLENNMPFYDPDHIFLFNGELRGVRLKVPGRIGAEKIFNFIKRLNRGDLLKAFQRAIQIIAKQTRYVRAMNIFMTDGNRIFVSSQFGEDPNYFTLHRRVGPGEAFCSQPLSGNWIPIANHTTLVV